MKTPKRPRSQILSSTIPLILALLICRATYAGDEPVVDRPGPGIEEWLHLELLPTLRPAVRVGCVSSYDRTGGNDDGFSGTYSFLRKEAEGLVIADLEGPGVIYRIHTPSPSADLIEFYFDGETAPRLSLKITELFDGAHPPFLKPLVGSGAGGHYCYVPITYQRSCKIVVKAATFRFYQINYARYPEDADIATFEASPSAAFLRRVEEAGKILAQTGSDISARLVPDGTRIETRTLRETLEPGRTLVLFEDRQPGRIVGLKLGPAAAFAGKDRDVVIKMYWDGDPEPAVLSPAGDFFGYGFGEPAMRSLFLGTSEGTNYAYFPMPYEKSARIELVSERSAGPALEIRAEIEFASLGKTADEGRFHAYWRRENPTRAGVPFTYLKTAGQGHVIGTILQAQGILSGQTLFFEGDDRAVIDGELAIPGTGSEDSFNGGWYDVPGRWEARASFPLSGCLDYQKPLGRTGGYRWLITDAYRYAENIDFTIEHAPTENRDPTDYAGVTFFYSRERPTEDVTLPAVAERRIVDPDRIVFVPGWNVPIRTFSLQNATLAKRVAAIGKDRIRYLEFKTTDGDVFGLHHVSFICDLPAAGRYKIGLKAVLGPEQGIVQMKRFDNPVGEPVNLYAEERRASPELPLGILDLSEGGNAVFLVLVGKDERAQSTGLDLVELIFERVQ